ncbi:hypothetical protein JTE90_017385 [Oedothorax gibbosus]|uniref:Uncharacterized protein n=2 Tax=Oedothorax gibbosus TaxID=931172 RepID=A0AAV6VPU8_9ARAC|nr:hypothetical protein JTE90_017385 [Oedothorax gibbosus]
MKLLWCVAVLVSTFVSAERGTGLFEECGYIEVCEEEDGFYRAEYCYNQLSLNDKDFLLKEFSDFYGKILNITSTLTHCCANREKGKKALQRYYDNRMEYEKKNDTQKLEDRKKMVAARGCFMLMISECRNKHVMGLV